MKTKLGFNKAAVLAVARKVFFKAMLAGYAGAGGAEKTKYPNGRVTIRYRDPDQPDYIVLDEYWVTPYSDSSSGTTTILY